MRYFLDTEFLEDGKTIELISIGIVAEDGREFYAENMLFDWDRPGLDWLNEHVKPYLQRFPLTWDRGRIAAEVLRFCDPSKHGKPEFWGYYADYDWVVFCWLFGRMIDKPEGFPMLCFDLKQWSVLLGNPALPEQSSQEHHALSDARWNRDVYQFLSQLEVPQVMKPRDLRTDPPAEGHRICFQWRYEFGWVPGSGVYERSRKTGELDVRCGDYWLNIDSELAGIEIRWLPWPFDSGEGKP